MSRAAVLDPGAAWVLHTMPFKESSMICHLLTEHYGKISVIVNGAYSKKKRALLSPFQELWLEVQGSGELKKLKKIEVSQVLPVLKGTRSFCGFYLNELLLKSLEPYCQVPIIFSAYTKCIKDLSHKNMSYCLREFEINWLQALGYALPFDQVRTTNYDYYSYCVDNGFIGMCDPIGFSVPRAILLAIAEKKWAIKGVDTVAKKLFRQAMQPVIKYQKLQSRELWNDINY